jgi:hypothetical protein
LAGVVGFDSVLEHWILHFETREISDLRSRRYVGSVSKHVEKSILYQSSVGFSSSTTRIRIMGKCSIYPAYRSTGPTPVRLFA